MSNTEIFIGDDGDFHHPYLIWRVGRTDYYAPLVGKLLPVFCWPWGLGKRFPLRFISSFLRQPLFNL